MDNLQAKKRNVNIYTRYKMFSWDFLFYYAIIFLFFTETKGINAADVLLAESSYPIFKMALLIPGSIFIETIGKRNSLIIGNIFVCASIITYLLANSFLTIILGEFLAAIGFVIKGVCESNILYNSLEKNEERGIKFAKIEGKGIAYYYWIDAITSIASGFLFVINGYIPMVLCLITAIISTALSVKFREIDDDVKSKSKINRRKVYRETRSLFRAFRSFSKSPRLRNLVTFGALLSAIFLSVTMLRSSIMQDIGIPSSYFGIIFAILGGISAISAKNAARFHKKYRNKTLTALSIPLILSFIIIGIIANINVGYIVCVTVIMLSFIIQYIVRGPFNPLIKQYLNNFTTSSVRDKISSSFNLLENILRFIITLSASILLRITDTANTFLLLGIVLGIIVILMLYNMRNKVGLKPEEYSEKDIKILELR